MAILGDPEKRELYDQTGSMDAADMDGDAVKSLYKFLRTLFKQVQLEYRFFSAKILLFSCVNELLLTGDRGRYRLLLSIISRFERGDEGLSEFVYKIQG